MPKQSRWWLVRELLTRPLIPPYANEEGLAKAVAVTTVPFNCYLDGYEPDHSNQAIAETAALYMRRYGLPFYGQREHTNLLRENSALEDLGIFRFDSFDGDRVQSQRLVKWQAEHILHQEGGNRVITVGMPEHLGRVVILQQYFGLDPRVVPESESVPYDPRDRPGAQDWCKTREKFEKYENSTGRFGTIGKALLMPWEF